MSMTKKNTCAIAVLAVTGCLVPLASASGPAQAYAANPTQVVQWVDNKVYPGDPIQILTRSRTIRSSDVGKTIELRAGVSTEQANIVCNEGSQFVPSITYWSRTKKVTVNQDFDWSVSGCWVGGLNLVTKVTADMVGSELSMGAFARPVNSATSFAVDGKVTLGTNVYTIRQQVLKAPAGAATPTPDPKPSTPATPAPDPKPSTPATSTTTSTMTSAWYSDTPVTVVLTTRTITGADLGKNVTFEVHPDMDQANMACGQTPYTVTYRAQGANVDTRAWIDPYTMGCWNGGANATVKVIPEMVGTSLVFTTTANANAGVTSTSLAGAVTIDGSKLSLSTTATKSAGKAPTKPLGTGTWKVDPSEWSNAIPVGSSRVNNTTDGSNLSALPKDTVWAGGAEYYKKFPAAVKAGWSDPNFFPVATWWDYNHTDASVKADKVMGINTYVLTNDSTDAKVLEANGISYLGQAGQKLANEDQAPNLKRPGVFLDDELDGRMGLIDAQAELRKLTGALPNHDQFRYTNYTAGVYSGYRQGQLTSDGRTVESLQKSLVNDFTDVVSTDNYWYAGALCNGSSIDSSSWMYEFTKATCRTPQSYGRNAESLRQRDAADGKVQPTMNFVENMRSSMSDSEPVYYAASPTELSGAAMSTLIHGSNALLWFNQSYANDNNPYISGNVMASLQDPNYAGKGYAAEQKKLNNLAQQLAPVLNTQTTLWNFGDGIDSMFKVTQGGSYVFAMPTDSGANKGPGTKTFRVPAALKGETVTVVGENRTIAMGADGTFTDSFADLTSYHVYKIA